MIEVTSRPFSNSRLLSCGGIAGLLLEMISVFCSLVEFLMSQEEVLQSLKRSSSLKYLKSKGEQFRS